MLDFYSGNVTLEFSSKDSGGFFQPSYDVSEIKVKFVAWDDVVGRYLQRLANEPISRLNAALCSFWNAVNKLKEVKPQDFKYESKQNEIEGLWLKYDAG